MIHIIKCFRQAALPQKRKRFASTDLRGDLKPGEILPNEAELGRWLGSSRALVAEAVMPLRKRVLEAIRNRHPELARENMAVLLSSTREFLERELAGAGHDRADEVRAAARRGFIRSTIF